MQLFATRTDARLSFTTAVCSIFIRAQEYSVTITVTNIINLTFNITLSGINLVNLWPTVVSHQLSEWPGLMSLQWITYDPKSHIVILAATESTCNEGTKHHQTWPAAAAGAIHWMTTPDDCLIGWPCSLSQHYNQHCTRTLNDNTTVLAHNVTKGLIYAVKKVSTIMFAQGVWSRSLGFLFWRTLRLRALSVSSGLMCNFVASFSHLCASVTKQYNLVPAKAGE